MHLVLAAGRVGTGSDALSDREVPQADGDRLLCDEILVLGAIPDRVHIGDRGPSMTVDDNPSCGSNGAAEGFSEMDLQARPRGQDDEVGVKAGFLIRRTVLGENG